MDTLAKVFIEEGVEYSANFSLASLSYWRIGGNTDFYCEPRSLDELLKILKIVTRLKAKVLVIGDGSNLLFDDEGFRGVIVKIGEAFGELKFLEGDVVYAGAGCWVPCLARRVGSMGLSGIEHTVGIPGRLGGLLIMNGGSQRKSIGTNVVEVVCVKYSGDVVRFNNEECEFGYRSSILSGSEMVVVGVLLKFSRGVRSQIISEMRGILRDRSSKFPRKLPNCGSVFLSRPSMYSELGPPGKIIESVGLKGLKIGAAKVSDKHANFIVNCGGATSSDVLRLIHLVRDQVFQKTGFKLECEVRHVSVFGEVRPAHVVATED